MKSYIDRQLDAISVRALHDPEMREVLSQVDIYASDLGSVRTALNELTTDQREVLFERSEALERSSGRSNEIYDALNGIVHRRWAELLRERIERSNRVMAKMGPALEAIRAGDVPAYEAHRAEFDMQQEQMEKDLTKDRVQLRRVIRSETRTLDPKMPTDVRAPLVEHMTRAVPVPPAIADLLLATSRLAAAKAQHDASLEQRRQLGPTPSPRANLDFGT